MTSNINKAEGGPEGLPSAADNSVSFYVMKDGKVIRQGRCPKHSLEQQVINLGESVHEGNPPEPDVSDEEVVTHSVARARAYPSIGDQLDALWKLLAAKPELLTPEAREIAEQIATVKKDFPKEMVFVPNPDQDGPAYVAHAFRDEFNPS